MLKCTSVCVRIIVNQNDKNISERRADMKRITLVLCIILMLCICVSASPIFKYEDTVPITDTVTLTNVREFHADYNISYSFIKMDLTDERVKLKLLTSDEGTDVLSYMSDLAATDENTVAAINGDFFSVYSGNKGFSLGIEKQDGEIFQSPINPDTMATVAYDGRNLLMTYLDFHVMVVAPNWEYKEIRHINKHTSYYGDLLMYTHEFNGGYSPAPGGDVLEVVIEDNVVTEFRRNLEPCLIPENGCVLVVSEGSSMFFENNLSVGDEIHFDWYVTPSLDEFDTAFGGGSMLVYEGRDVGKVGDYTHTVAGFHPRSAIGVDKEGKTLYLVAVDGRQTSSRGMRMSHLAELMIELGCYTAVNLDGGGSTRMLASTMWHSDMYAVNNPTENRKVINAIGIVLNNKTENDEEKETNDDVDNAEETADETYEQSINQEKVNEPLISGIKIKPSKQVAFVGEEIKLDVSAHDEQLRPVYMDFEELGFSASEGEINDGKLVCDTGGNVTVGVLLGEHYAETQVYYVDEISGIVTDGALKLSKGNEHQLPVYVFDYYGRFLKPESLEAFEITSSDENVVTVEDGIVTAVGNGNAIITVSKGNIKSFVSVAVGTYSYDYLYDFEKIKGSFVSYPEDTKGSFELSDEYSLSGQYSGKLSFDFTEEPEPVTISEETRENSDDTLSDEKPEMTATDETAEPRQVTSDEISPEITAVNEAPADVSKAVYFSLDSNVVFDNENRLLQICVYSDDAFNHEVRAQLVYGNGRVKNMKFDGEVFEDRWNTLTLEVPEELAYPVYLSRIYVLYTPGEEKDSGCIYIDDVSMTSMREYVPKVSPGNVYRYNTNNSGIASKVVVSAVPEWNNGNPVTLYEKTRVENHILSKNGIVISDNMKKTVSEDDNAVYVYLDTSDGGIRNTDSSQWELLTKAVEMSNRKNLFIITNNGIFGNDEFENEVVRDYLASLDKDVFVVSPGKADSFMNIDGVSYFTLDSTPVTEISLVGGKRRNAVEFHFGNCVTFEFKSI